ncbi:hypothetical protein scyTo_0023080 [Scyliorhinus torazame]|uniref:Uncharacterized protein n=1 Tax=Scyliorhinus torazame TaxID=75743 RepID=A0A401QAM4_SCYTO|nr:hypothetical protein [Scyliorhinus torazame]
MVMKKESSDSAGLDQDVKLSVCSHNEANVGTIEDRWTISVMLNGTAIKCKLYTGARAKLIPISVVQQLKIKPHIVPAGMILKDYNG